jgi:hypothetical protein
MQLVIIKSPAYMSHKGFKQKFTVKQTVACKFPRINLMSLENHPPEARVL